VKRPAHLWIQVWRGCPRPRNASSERTPLGQSKPFQPSLFIALIAIIPLAVQAQAQRQAMPGLHGPAANFSQHAGARQLGSRRTSRAPFAALPFPFFGDSFNPENPGDESASGDSGAVPPFLMQALQSLTGPGAASLSPAMNARGNRAPTSSEPLMIELQNGRYVRVKGNAIDGEAQPLAPLATKNSQSAKLLRDHAAKPTAALPATPLLAAGPLSTVVLVFRDGHREEVRDYTIANNTLYATGDYYTDGYWNKKIDLAALNIPNTLETNAKRNVKFILPSSSSEVVARF
jgi:hypothetical protein